MTWRHRRRPLAGALVPLVLSISFALIQDGMLATAHCATGVANGPERLLTFSGTTSMVLFAAVAAVNALVTVAADLRLHCRNWEGDGLAAR